MNDLTNNTTTKPIIAFRSMLRQLVADRAAIAGNFQEAYQLIANSWSDAQYLDLIKECTLFSRVETKLLVVIKSIDGQLAQSAARSKTVGWIYKQYGQVLGTPLHNEFVEWLAYISTDKTCIIPVEDIRLNGIITYYYTCLAANLAHYN